MSTKPPRLLIDYSPSAVDAYVTLSYCWGGPQLLELRKARLDSYVAGLPIHELPQTILDAFRVTQELGFRFIWIDSLCIIQDSLDDKLQEISRMAEIYNRSSLCIVAANSASVQSGFLGPRDDFISENHRVPFLCKDGTLGTISMSSSRPQAYFYPEDNPIEQRAWTYQERLLSPRVLIYSHNGLRYVCRTGSESNVQGSRWFARNMEPTHTEIASADPHVWRDLVMAYSRRALSVPSDKLLAIAALARMHTEGRDPGEQYLAGLWASSIVGDLLWESLFESQAEDGIEIHCAPSWSWASTDSRVSWPTIVEEKAFPTGNNERQDFVLLDAQVMPRPGNTAYGQVDCGRLFIRGRTVRLSAEQLRNLGWGLSGIRRHEDVSTWRPSPLRLFEPPNPERQFGGQTWVDDPVYSCSYRMSFDSSRGGCRACVLLLVAVVDSSKAEGSPEKRLCGLILEAVGDDREESVFRRVGMFEFELDSKLRVTTTEAIAGKSVVQTDEFSCLRSLECADFKHLSLV